MRLALRPRSSPTWERQESREREFAALLADARARLARLYASGAPPEEMRRAKEREFGRLKFEYAQLRARWGGYAGYDAWFDRALNNAHLAAVATYENCVPGLTRELEAAGSLPAFHRRAAELGQWPHAARHAAVCTGDVPVNPHCSERRIIARSETGSMPSAAKPFSVQVESTRVER